MFQLFSLNFQCANTCSIKISLFSSVKSLYTLFLHLLWFFKRKRRKLKRGREGEIERERKREKKERDRKQSESLIEITREMERN